jgi:hypothetical protein
MVPPRYFYYYGDQSKFFKVLRAHFAAKGVQPGTQKMEKLVYRWIAQKGYREPITGRQVLRSHHGGSHRQDPSTLPH